MLPLIAFIVAMVLFLVSAIQTKSLVSFGLAAMAAAFILERV